jgi:DNA-binding Lrp family transcriptional regulator
MPVLTDPRRLEVMKLLQAKSQMSQRDLAQVMGVSLCKANYCLKALTDKGLHKLENLCIDPIPGAVMEALWQREDPASGLHQDMRLPFGAVEPVKLVDGSLAGMEGVLTQQDGEKRMILLLELLGKANKVTVDRDRVARTA